VASFSSSSTAPTSPTTPRSPAAKPLLGSEQGVVGLFVEIVFHDPSVPTLAVAFQAINRAARPSGPGPDSVDGLSIVLIEPEPEDFQGPVKMMGVARADDGGGDAGAVENMVDGDGAQRDAVAISDRLEDA